MARRPEAAADRPQRARSNAPRSRAPNQREPPLVDGRSRLYVATVPGLGVIARQELAALPGVQVESTGFDRRSDILLLSVPSGKERSVLRLRTLEDVFLEVGRAQRASGNTAAAVAEGLWRPARVKRALAALTALRTPGRRPTYRVVARVLQEHAFLRTDLRRKMSAVIARHEPHWRPADPAAIEIWVAEYAVGSFIAGVRLSDASMRQHSGRRVERPGALRPAVAAAMVRLAGEQPGTLVDPCCGSGTILAEADAMGWRAHGVDIDPDAERAARSNAPRARVYRGDARELDVTTDSVEACVSNLPFNEQYTMQGDARRWMRAVLGEMSRVTRAGGRLVLLSKQSPVGAAPAGVRLVSTYPIELLGLKTTIWVLVKATAPGASSP